MPEFTVQAPHAGERLDRYLAAAQADLSRNRVQSLIREGHVRVNGQPSRASLRLRAGDLVSIEPPPRRATTLEPEAIALAIVHEDESLIVVDKPAGLVVHPGAGVARGTLVHALLHHDPDIAGVGGEGRPGIVHRLDKDTSGLMVIARTERAYRVLVEAMARREVTRRYRALVWGEPRVDEALLEGPIGRDPRHRQRMAVLPRGGRPARTRYRVTGRFGFAATLDLTLDTGRTHQIRVHLAHAGHPVIGDPIYGGRAKKLLSLREPERSLAHGLLDRLARQALHAAELEFRHPMTGQRLHFLAPVPEDFAEALDRLRAFRDSRRK